MKKSTHPMICRKIQFVFVLSHFLMLEVFYAYKEGYKHNDCVLKTKQSFAICAKQNFIKRQNSCDSVYIDLFVVKWMFFFSEVFINHLPKILWSVLSKITIDLSYFWNVYDINLWEKLAITVKLCFIESRAMICETSF